MNETDKFYQQLFRSLVKTQLRRGQTLETAEDLSQQAILQVFADSQTHPEKYKDEEAIRRVAHTTARNLLATLANRDKMMGKRHVLIKDHERFTLASNSSAEKEFFKRHKRRTINEALHQLPDTTRSMFERMADDESLTDIAESMNMPRGTAGKTIFSARKKLLRFLKGKG